MKWPTDPELGPVLSGAIWLLLLAIAFLAATLPFSAVLHSNAAVIGVVIGSLTGVLGLVVQARGRVARRDDSEK